MTLRDRINGNMWPLLLTASFTVCGFFLGNLVIKVDKIYDVVIENKVQSTTNKHEIIDIEKRVEKSENEIKLLQK